MLRRQRSYESENDLCGREAEIAQPCARGEQDAEEQNLEQPRIPEGIRQLPVRKTIEAAASCAHRHFKRPPAFRMASRPMNATRDFSCRLFFPACFTVPLPRLSAREVPRRDAASKHRDAAVRVLRIPLTPVHLSPPPRERHGASSLVTIAGKTAGKH